MANIMQSAKNIERIASVVMLCKAVLQYEVHDEGLFDEGHSSLYMDTDSLIQSLTKVHFDLMHEVEELREVFKNEILPHNIPHCALVN